MNTLTKVVIASTLVTAGGQALANDYKTTIEYRHQYVDGANKHSDRIKAFLDTGKGLVSNLMHVITMTKKIKCSTQYP